MSTAARRSRRRALLVSHHPARELRTARRWAREGDDVTVALLDAAVACARPGHVDGPALRAARADGVRVLAHDAALARRGLRAPVTEVEVCDTETLAVLVAEEAEAVVWL
ncbi:hypothetical protein ER308_12155 [Egibacter rhizosphaerae]|uniref:Sulfur reduction protein DsrE n=1 Tax=Egibacter rhizosphaerae TaxID=1670831 RepID=A0A411YGG6_9ACTN|nr:hypothetical protein [Egibacter rhizosphaerae]QBI20241.1 hypothetical protein ER308_12155 [Egibacter rhizosphaerae]